MTFSTMLQSSSHRSVPVSCSYTGAARHHYRRTVSQPAILTTFTGFRQSLHLGNNKPSAPLRLSDSRRHTTSSRYRRSTTKMMFERFTEKAIKVVMLAQEEARRLGHNFVGTEQILLGLIGESTGIAAKVRQSTSTYSSNFGSHYDGKLVGTCRKHRRVVDESSQTSLPVNEHGIGVQVIKSMGINLKEARTETEKIIGRGSGFVAVEIPFTPRAKRVLELSLEEARQLGACSLLAKKYGMQSSFTSHSSPAYSSLLATNAQRRILIGRAQLHWHRAHLAGSVERGRGRCSQGPGDPRRRPTKDSLLGKSANYTKQCILFLCFNRVCQASTASMSRLTTNDCSCLPDSALNAA